MASFARSLKSPFLSPRLRPSLPSRTLSSSSDISLPSNGNSPLSEDFADLSITDRSTPTYASGRGVVRDGSYAADSNPFFRDDHDPAAPFATSRPTTPRSHNSRSRPIAIELPSLKRLSATSARTPPEPLSARGDLPGGYFPLHEDPNTRVHRPHPFSQKDTRMAYHQQVSMIAESRPAYPDRSAPATTQGLSMTHSNTPVTSYLPAGFHDNPLPMGKYYPSNYEQQTHSHVSSLRPSLADSLPTHFHSEPSIAPRSTDVHPIITPESELQRRLKQYQRDMVAQASLAASELLSSSSSSTATLGTSVRLNSGGIHETRLKPPASLKPLSPRLLPLGSPGPVTPMSLESSGDNYIAFGSSGTEPHSSAF
ncbi:hypothetical protein BGZ63DRAFT_140629 [Mariannaea sp. PMI_226]|nr:hypothetical protein BGZ63DRAFT_140629 [Mariannaea sp. PMI_226]